VSALDWIDVAVECAAGGLFGGLSIVLFVALRRSGNVNRQNVLALAVVWIFGASCLHRFYHAYRIVSGRSFPNEIDLAVDTLVLVGLVAYAVARERAVVDDDQQPLMALFADRVGLERLEAEVRQLRSDHDLEVARREVFTASLRQVIEPMEELRQAAVDTIAGGDERERMQEILPRLRTLEEMSRILGVRVG
jgi:hypothetical protein